MKRLITGTLIALSGMTLLSGCLNLQLGGGSSSRSNPPTVGQQLIDLQRAKDSGAISDAEYDAEKAKLLGKL